MHIFTFVFSLIIGVVSTIQSCVVMGAGSIAAGLGADSGGTAFGGLLVFVSAILAFVGGTLSLKRKNSGWILLIIAGLLCLVGSSAGKYSDALIIGIGYFISAFFGILACRKKTQP